MEISELSESCAARLLTERDLKSLLRLCRGNPQYYLHCPPEASLEGLRADLRALPPGKTLRDKCYTGFFEGELLAAAADLILGYPDEDTVFIGFFMVDAKLQGKGFGSGLVAEMLACLKREYRYARLGYMADNRQSESFWKKNGFTACGSGGAREGRPVAMMMRAL